MYFEKDHSTLLCFISTVSLVIYARPLYSFLITTHTNVRLPYVTVAFISINLCLKYVYKDYSPAFQSLLALSLSRGSGSWMRKMHIGTWNSCAYWSMKWILTLHCSPKAFWRNPFPHQGWTGCLMRVDLWHAACTLASSARLTVLSEKYTV